MTKVVYFGNERLISGLDHTDAPILRGLIERGYDVVAVVSNYAGGSSRNQRALEVADIAKEHGIPVLLPAKPSDIIEELRGFHADIAVLAAYGRIVSQSVIDIFPQGIINIHPSLLPQYRGPTPIESAILNGDTETGVSIMQLTAGMDEGPVYAQTTIHIESDHKFTVYWRLSVLGAQLFFETFPKIIDGSLKPLPQDNAVATYSQLIKKSDGIIDWNKPAEQIVREIDAYSGWPQSRTTIGDIDVIITSASVTGPFEDTIPGRIIVIYDEDVKTLFVGTSQGQLEIAKLKPLGKKEMPIEAFLAGYRHRLDN